MYDFTAGGTPSSRRPASGTSTMAMRIDTLLTDPLRTSRPARSAARQHPVQRPARNLAFRNLTRANMVKLASGQQMAQKLNNRGVPVTPLTKQQILNGNGGAALDHLTASREGRPGRQGRRCGSTSCARPS